MNFLSKTALCLCIAQTLVWTASHSAQSSTGGGPTWRYESQQDAWEKGLLPQLLSAVGPTPRGQVVVFSLPFIARNQQHGPLSVAQFLAARFQQPSSSAEKMVCERLRQNQYSTLSDYLDPAIHWHMRRNKQFPLNEAICEIGSFIASATDGRTGTNISILEDIDRLPDDAFKSILNVLQSLRNYGNRTIILHTNLPILDFLEKASRVAWGADPIAMAGHFGLKLVEFPAVAETSDVDPGKVKSFLDFYNSYFYRGQSDALSDYAYFVRSINRLLTLDNPTGSAARATERVEKIFSIGPSGHTLLLAALGFIRRTENGEGFEWVDKSQYERFISRYYEGKDNSAAMNETIPRTIENHYVIQSMMSSFYASLPNDEEKERYAQAERDAFYGEGCAANLTHNSAGGMRVQFPYDRYDAPTRHHRLRYVRAPAPPYRRR